MSESERLVRFELLGQEFAFYTAASEEEMQTILALVRDQLEGGGSPRGTFPAGKVAVLACLNIASKFVQLKNDYDRYKLDVETRFARLNREICNSLQDD